MRFSTLIIGVIISIGILGSQAVAQTIANDECGIADILVDAQGIVIEDAVRGNGLMVSEELYPSDALIAVVENLQAACCAAGRLSRSKCPNTLPTETPSSRLLFNQVIEFGMRRMSGIPEQLYGYDTLVDPVAAKRRERINIQGSNPNGTPPGAFLNRFYADVVPSSADQTLAAKQAVIGGDADNIVCSDLVVYESLIARIQQQCAIAYCVTEGLYDRAALVGDNTARQGLQVLYRACLDTQQERVIEEYNTTTNIMKTQANIFAQRAQEEYLQNYFVNTRMITLAEKITRQVSLLEIINTKYTEGTKMCN